jgi:hypothetical protein
MLFRAVMIRKEGTIYSYHDYMKKSQSSLFPWPSNWTLEFYSKEVTRQKDFSYLLGFYVNLVAVPFREQQ